MTVTDALEYFKGRDTAATGYLRKTTSPNLQLLFAPLLKNRLKRLMQPNTGKMFLTPTINLLLTLWILILIAM